MITFAAFVPHSPLLLDSIGKENTKALQETREAFIHLAEELHVSRPDILLCISAHKKGPQETFCVNTRDSFQIGLQEFGDLTTYKSFAGNLPFVTELQRRMRSEPLPFSLETDAVLDYHLGIPLSFFESISTKTSIVPVSFPNTNAKSLVHFGKILKDICLASPKRVAIIAAGELSHRLSSASPIGYHASGPIFDHIITEAIQQMSLSQLLSIDKNLRDEAHEQAYEALLILFGVLEKIPLRPEILSYEGPFGVGEMNVHFHLSGV